MTQCPDREGNGRPPLVSVGIPVFNGENYLDEAIRSHIRRVLHKYAQNVTRASVALGISRTTLRKWMT